MANDLISREAAIKMIRENGLRGEGYSQEEREDNLVDMLECLPAVDAAPAMHGRWIKKPFLLGTTNVCDKCGEYYGMPHGMFNYCPNCGAKMDREE